jgi:serine/threonine-protein kinase RsbW
VAVRVPADFAQLTMLRALAETVALIVDFALDEVTDIRVAVDEVATALMSAAVADSSVQCEFDYVDGRMMVAITGLMTTDDALDEHGFGWHVLRTIADAPTARSGPFDIELGGYPVTVEFGRARGERDAG